jgi:hypothetical protein
MKVFTESHQAARAICPIHLSPVFAWRSRFGRVACAGRPAGTLSAGKGGPAVLLKIHNGIVNSMNSERLPILRGRLRCRPRALSPEGRCAVLTWRACLGSYSIVIRQERPMCGEAGHVARREMEIPMKGMILAAFIAVGVTGGIASAGIGSLADGAAVLINASSRTASAIGSSSVSMTTTPGITSSRQGPCSHVGAGLARGEAQNVGILPRHINIDAHRRL